MLFNCISSCGACALVIIGVAIISIISTECPVEGRACGYKVNTAAAILDVQEFRDICTIQTISQLVLMY